MKKGDEVEMMSKFKEGDKVRPKKEYLGKDSKCGGRIDKSWAGTITELNETMHRVSVENSDGSDWWIMENEIELDGPPPKPVVLLKYQPGTSIAAFVKQMLKVEKDKERIRQLRAFDQCVLPKHVRETVEEALTVILRKDLFEKWGLNDHFEKGITNAILLYGPPGTGKTLVSESIAAVLGKNLLRVSSGDFQSPMPGETERNIQNAFKQAAEQDAVLMLDECDSVLSDRNSVGVILGAEINALLTELERFPGTVVLTTNRLHRLDPALQRRIIAKVELPPPEYEARQQIWRKLTPPRMPISKDVNFDVLAKAELTGGEIKNIILLAARKAIARNQRQVTMSHFEESLVSVQRSKEDFESQRPKDLWNFHSQDDKRPSSEMRMRDFFKL